MWQSRRRTGSKLFGRTSDYQQAMRNVMCMTLGITCESVEKYRRPDSTRHATAIDGEQSLEPVLLFLFRLAVFGRRVLAARGRGTGSLHTARPQSKHEHHTHSSSYLHPRPSRCIRTTSNANLSEHCLHDASLSARAQDQEEIENDRQQTAHKDHEPETRAFVLSKILKDGISGGVQARPGQN